MPVSEKEIAGAESRAVGDSSIDEVPSAGVRRAAPLLLVDALMRESAKRSLSGLLRVSQRLSLAQVIRHFLLKEQLLEGIALRALDLLSALSAPPILSSSPSRAVRERLGEV